MKKLILVIAVISVLVIPAVSPAAYLIQLKNGGEFATPQYWMEGQEIRFYIGTGIMGLEKGLIAKIEKFESEEIDSAFIVTPPPQPIKPTLAPAASVETKSADKKIDLKAYQDKMAKLKVDLNRTLTRIKKATTRNDLIEKEAAMADNRRISAEMWQLTDELKSKNKGKLPADWWEGVGKEEPNVR